MFVLLWNFACLDAENHIIEIFPRGVPPPNDHIYDKEKSR